MSNIHSADKDDDVSGQIVGGDYLVGAVFYDGRKQSGNFYEASDDALIAMADEFIAEKRAELGETFDVIWPLALWQLRIAA